jgi:hypothetical protein
VISSEVRHARDAQRQGSIKDDIRTDLNILYEVKCQGKTCQTPAIKYDRCLPSASDRPGYLDGRGLSVSERTHHYC